jgi:adenylosuccinate synthase
LNLTKLDVLDSFPELQVATEYSVDGEPLESFPADLSILGQVNVSYKTLPGWQTPTTGAKSYSDLPKNAQMYIEFIEGFVGIKVKYIGIGPGRQNMIMR